MSHESKITEVANRFWAHNRLPIQPFDVELLALPHPVPFVSGAPWRRASAHL